MREPSNHTIPHRSPSGLTKTAPSTTKEVSIRLLGTSSKIRGRDDTTIGTWNTRALKGAGKLQELTHEMDRYTWNILGLCEMRWLSRRGRRTGKISERLDKASTACGIETSAEKTKLMTNNTSGINKEIKVNGQKPETVTSFKYLGSFVSDWGSKNERLHDSTDDSSIDKVDTTLEQLEYFSQFQDTTDALPSHIYLPVCL